MVEGFTTTLEVVKLFEPVLDSISSKLLRKLVTLASDGGEDMVYYSECFCISMCVVSLSEIFIDI